MKKILIINIAILIILIIMYGSIIDENIVSKRQTNYTVWKEVGTAGYLGIDIYETIKNLFPKDQEKMLEEVARFKQGHDTKKYAFPQKKNIENVIMIQLEGVDSIAINMQKDNSFIMKNLNSLKEHSIWFENVLDQTGSGRTSDGEFLALTSLLPVNGESMFTQYDLSKLSSLPKYMNEIGKFTVAFHGNEAAFWNREQTHSALGYDQGYYKEQIEKEVEDNYEGWGLSDRTVLRKTYEVIEKTEKPVFTHTILLTGHHPYTAVNNMDLELPYKAPATLVENYINCLYYTDLALGEFINELQRSGVLETSLLIIFADHDSGITEDIYDYCGINYNEEDINCDKVPLILYDGINQYVEESIMGQADIFPLILSYLDLEFPQYIMGANFVDGKKVVYLQKGMVTETKNLESNSYDMDTITRAIVNLGDDNKHE